MSCKCYIGILHNYEDTRLVNLEELKEHIQERFGYAKWKLEIFGECEKSYTLSDYCDKRKNTDLTRFNYCPFCSNKIDWKLLKKEVNE